MIEAGGTLLHYRLVEKIGEGGMGVVWKAVDTTLDREVAIKVLPDVFSGDPERLARFEREAKLLASLQHPNIASIYGFHDSDGVRFVAMELVEGDDLSIRLTRGALPLDEALEIAGQIADALSRAHDSGVVHRDLKPANLQVGPDGSVKVLDFGLAKAFEVGPASGSGSASVSLSPTVTSAGTMPGVILGTAGYMSPEQARGKTVDKRADVWAFGCVLYEMLTGRQLFGGETVSDTLASVLKSEPDFDALPAETPRSIRRLLRRCLVKDLRERLRDMADAKIEIAEAGPAEPAAEREPASKMPWIVAAAAVVLAVVAFAVPRPGPGAGDSAAGRYAGARVTIPTESLDLATARVPFVLSRNERLLAYSAIESMASHLYIRELDSFETRRLPGTEDAHAPFFSPDSRWIGFYAGGKLKKMAVAGGSPEILADAPAAAGGAIWMPDDTILFSTAYARVGLERVSVQGGAVEQVTLPDGEAGEFYHFGPRLLPGGKTVLFHIEMASETRVALLDLSTNEWRTIPDVRGRVDYAPSGHLVYGEDDQLLAVPFDTASLQITGAPFPALEEVLPLTDGPAFTVSEAGSLLYMPGNSAKQDIAWADRSGNFTSLDAGPGKVLPRLSPSGRLVALRGGDPGLTVVDLERGGRHKLTSLTSGGFLPDERFMVNSDRVAGTVDLFLERADGTGERNKLTDSDHACWATSVRTDGKWALFYEQHPETGRDIYALALDGEEAEPEPLVVTPANERSARFSPDGKWFVYTSNRTGRDEVYVRRFEPRGEHDYLVSTEGGREPVWAWNGSELYYRVGRALMAVPVELGDTFETSGPQRLFEADFGVESGGMNPVYDTAPDGRFLITRRLVDVSNIRLALGWSEELKGRE